MASDYIQDNEIKMAIERSGSSLQNNKSIIIPIPVRSCDIESSPLKDFQSAIKDFKPESSWQNKDDAWMDDVIRLKKLILDKFKTIQN